jgi:hypothetical protein
MRKLLFLAIAVLCTLFYTTSCTKTVNVTKTVYDTTLVKDTTVLKDTTVIKDTITLRDTIIIKNPANPIVGVWAGIYFVDWDAVDSSAYTFYIRSDHQIITAAGGGYVPVTYSTGSWTLSGTTFTTTIHTLYGEPANAQTITCTYDSTAGTLVGTWQDVSGPNHSSGTVHVTRVD